MNWTQDGIYRKENNNNQYANKVLMDISGTVRGIEQAKQLEEDLIEKNNRDSLIKEG